MYTVNLTNKALLLEALTQTFFGAVKLALVKDFHCLPLCSVCCAADYVAIEQLPGCYVK